MTTIAVKSKLVIRVARSSWHFFVSLENLIHMKKSCTTQIQAFDVHCQFSGVLLLMLPIAVSYIAVKQFGNTHLNISNVSFTHECTFAILDLT
jgi:hypothetical protein